jgi:hypothetical protein
LRNKKNKNGSVNKYLQELTGENETNYSLWRATKHLKRPVCHKPPLRRENGTWAKENKENVGSRAHTETFALTLRGPVVASDGMKS